MYVVGRAPGFMTFFHATDDMRHVNYAIPDADWERAGGGSFALLRREFEGRSRLPRLEFIEEFAPTLPDALRAAGFVEEYRGPMMLCTRETLAAAPDVAGLTVERVDRNDDEALRELVRTQREGFGVAAGWTPTPEDLVYPRAALVDGAAFVGRYGGRYGGRYSGRYGGAAVGAGLINRPHDGLTELAGVATLEAYRRRGVAAAVCVAAAAHAFDSGVEAVCLSAGDEGSTRVYERAGFSVVATMLAYADP